VVPATKFHAGSIAKSLASLVIFDAAGAGELELRVPCSEQATGLWPDTPWELMAQTTGRPNVLPEVDEDLEEFVVRVGGMPRLHAPGTFSYCNSGWSVLDLLLRKRTGHTFETRARELLGTDLTFGAPPDGAHGHAIGADFTTLPAPPDYAEAASAAGARWWASTGELLDYARLHLDASRTGIGSVEAPDVLEMQRVHAAIPGATVADGWGLGWAVWDRGEHRAFGWAGYTGGHRAQLRCFPDQDALLVMVANAAGPLFGPPGGSAAFDRVFPEALEMLGVPPLPEPARDQFSGTVSDFAGDYGPITVEPSGRTALLLHAEAVGEQAPIRYRSVGGNAFCAEPARPGGLTIAFAGDLLYLGPMAFARSSSAARPCSPGERSESSAGGDAAFRS
jgi:CubicO group peptidase (beta-lactamase class C family)